MLTMGSLFSGSGGFELASQLSGIKPVWASEIEPFCITVTKKNFPGLLHLGSVTEIDGAKIPIVDIITGGSPCQQLSISGNRKGLEGQASSLFYEQIRIVKEMREATEGKCPRWMVWENVRGAFSSNKGRDFQRVLAEIIGIAEQEAPIIPVPEKGWPDAGCFMGDDWSVAYRLLDAEYWGAPQRRNRIFLVADFRGQSAGKILFERTGLRRDSSESCKAQQTNSSGNSGGAGKAGEDIYVMVDNNERDYGINVSPTLNSRDYKSPHFIVRPTEA